MQTATMPNAPRRVVGFMDDEDDVASFVGDTLASFGLESQRFSDMKEAESLASKGNAVAFVLDVQVNAKSLGLDVLERLKEIDPNAFVCIYSGYVDRPSLCRRAKRSGANFIQAKTHDPKNDLCLVAREVLKHQLEMLELELARNNGPNPSSIDSDKHTIDTISQFQPDQSPDLKHPIESNSADQNAALFQRLICDEDWRKAHLGLAVAIVDGVVVDEGDSLDSVILRCERKYPLKDRFVAVVGNEVEVIDIPVPFDIEV